jgi:hypothetical protein
MAAAGMAVPVGKLRGHADEILAAGSKRVFCYNITFPAVERQSAPDCNRSRFRSPDAPVTVLVPEWMHCKRGSPVFSRTGAANLLTF